MWPTSSVGSVVGRLVSRLIQVHKKERFDDLATLNNHSCRSTVAIIAIHEANPYCYSIPWTRGSQAKALDSIPRSTAHHIPYACAFIIMYHPWSLPRHRPLQTQCLFKCRILSPVCLLVAGDIQGRKNIWNDMGIPIAYCVLCIAYWGVGLLGGVVNIQFAPTFISVRHLLWLSFMT